MAGTNSRIKDISTTTTSPASDDYAPFDGSSNGTRRALWSALVTDAAAIFVAAPTTYKLCPLNGSNQIDVTYLSTSANIPKGAWDATANTPTLADGGGTVGDYYDVTVAGTQNLGSASITYTVGDVVKYNGTIWYKIDSVANLFDGTSTQSGAATAGDYYQTADVNDRQLSKSLSNALVFTTDTDNLSMGDSDLFSFGDGTTNTPGSIVIVTNVADHSDNGDFVAKYGSSAGTREWRFGVTSSFFRFIVEDGASVEVKRTADAVATPQNGKTTCWGMSYTADSADATAMNDVSLYQNGVAVASTATNNGSFAGFFNSGQVCSLNRATGASGDGFYGSVYRCYIFNRALTAAEHAYINTNGLDDADQWGKADGVPYTSDFTSNSIDGFTFDNSNTPTSDATATVGADTDNVKFIAGNVTGSARMWKGVGALGGKRYRISFDYYMPSGQTYVDGFKTGLNVNETSGNYTDSATLATNAWTPFTTDLPTLLNPSNSTFFIKLEDGGSATVNALAVGEYIAFRDIKVTEIGAVLALNPDNIQSDGDWIDASSNELNGTNTGATPLMVQPQTSGTFTPVLEFATPVSTRPTYSVQQGRWNKVSEKVIKFSIRMDLSNKGDDTGTARISGMPFTALPGISSVDQGVCNVVGMASLTSRVTYIVPANDTDLSLWDGGAAGDTALLDTNFTNSSAFLISGTYEIA